MRATRLLLREQVKEMILERILAGEYEPGERLVETRLAQELGTSQVPVREALRELEVLRFVESEPFRGARVRAVSRAEMVEIFPVRAAIEEVAVRLATVQLDGDVEELERQLAAMDEAPRQRRSARAGRARRRVPPHHRRGIRKLDPARRLARRSASRRGR